MEIWFYATVGYVVLMHIWSMEEYILQMAKRMIGRGDMASLQGEEMSTGPGSTGFIAVYFNS